MLVCVIIVVMRVLVCVRLGYGCCYSCSWGVVVFVFGVYVF